MRLRPAVAVQGLFVLFGVVIAAFFPFFTLFLRERGLDPTKIGTVIAVMAVARIGTNPVWGHLADVRLGRRTVLQITTLASSAAALLLFALGNSFGTLVAIAALFAAAAGTLGPNVDAIALAHLGDERLHRYGFIRAWESLSYAIATVLLGVILTETRVEYTVPIYACAALLVLAWSFTLAKDPPHAAEEHGRLGAVGSVFREAPRFAGYLAAMLLVWVGFAAAWNFLALRIEDQGGTPRLVGLGLALGGAAEVPVMLLSSRMMRRFGLRAVYVAGTLVYATGFMVWGLISSPLLISLASVFEGLGFGLLFTSGVVIVGKLVPEKIYSTGQSVASTVGFGLGPIIGGLVGGFLYGHFGSVTTYVTASALAFTGAVLAYVALNMPAFTTPEAVEVQHEGAPPPVV